MMNIIYIIEVIIIIIQKIMTLFKYLFK